MLAHCEKTDFVLLACVDLSRLDIRVYGRRNDLSIENDVLSSDRSLMSADSIEPSSDGNEIFRKRTTLSHYSPVKNFINRWNRIKTPMLDSGNNDVKDLLTVANKKQARLVRVDRLRLQSIHQFVSCVSE